MAKFKIGDRVRVIEGPDFLAPSVKIGATGTIKEDSVSPWIHFDNKTDYPLPCEYLSIPANYAAVVNESRLELTSYKDTSERDDLAKQFMRDIRSDDECCQMDDELWEDYVFGLADEAFDLADAFMAEKERRRG